MERLSLDSSSVNISTDLLQVYTSRGDSNRQLQLSVADSRVEMKDLLRANRLKATKLSTHSVSVLMCTEQGLSLGLCIYACSNTYLSECTCTYIILFCAGKQCE